MPLARLPFEENGNLVVRWWRQTIRPFRFRSLRSLWDELYRGNSILSPVGFAYLWVLVLCPVLALALKLGLMGLRAKMGPYSSMWMANVMMVVPGALASVLYYPLLFMFLGGSIAHGLLCLMAQNARGHFRGTLRIFGYGFAWMLPFTGVMTAVSLYMLLNPFAGFSGGFPNGIVHETPPLIQVLGYANLVFGTITLVLVIWGLASFHRIAIWKTIVAGVVAFVVVAATNLVLVQLASKGAVNAILGIREARQKEESTPKGRITRLIKQVENLQEETQKRFKKVGLPPIPRSVDILTGGNWGAAMDLKQASDSGFTPSSQIIYEQTLAALKGQVIYFSSCLGESSGGSRWMSFGQDIEPVLPPGAEAKARQVHEHLTEEQRTVLARARSDFRQTILFIQAEVGPFTNTARPPEFRRPEVGEFPVAPIQPKESQLSPRPKVVIPLPPSGQNDPSRPFNASGFTHTQLLVMARDRPDVMDALGRAYFDGRLYVKPEFRIPASKEESLKTLTKAYENGFRNAHSCGMVAYIYNTGSGVPADHGRAQMWVTRAHDIDEAERRSERWRKENVPYDLSNYRLAELIELAPGNPKIMNELGKIFQFGRNATGLNPHIPENLSESVKWLLKAYNSGIRDPDSVGLLMTAYGLGRGVAVDLAESKRWENRLMDMSHTPRNPDPRKQPTPATGGQIRQIGS